MRILSKSLLSAMNGGYEFTTAGSHSFYIPQRMKVKLTVVGSGKNRTYMDMWVIAAGGYRNTGYWSAGDGGGYFKGQVMLPAGAYSLVINESTLYTVTSTDIASGKPCNNQYATTNNVILSNSNGDLITVGTGITLSSNLEIVYGTVEHEQTGNTAQMDSNYQMPYGGASLYNGYGKGSDANASNNTLGYFKLEFM